MFDDNRPHVMRLLRSAPGQGEEWFCPECGCHLWLRWHPEYEQQQLAPGDEGCTHVGGADAKLIVAANFEAELLDAAGIDADGAARAGFNSGSSEWAAPPSDASDVGDPERADRLAPWLELLERLSREGLS